MTAIDEPSVRAGRAITATAIGLFSFGLLLFVVDLVAVESHATASFDRRALLDIHHDLSSGLRPVMLFVTAVGGPWGMTVLTALASLHFFRLRALHGALIMLIGLGGAELLDTIIKLAVHRPRPHLWHTLAEHTSSFPSGHATAAMAACLALVFSTRHWHGRVPAAMAGVFAGIVVALVGFSRLYLGVHYPSDVVGGYLLALWWVSLTALVATRLAPPPHA